MAFVSNVLGYVAPLLILCLTLLFWRYYDATDMDLRRDRKNVKRRGDFRARIRWPVAAEASIGSIQGRTRNVSVSGATIVSLHPFTRGEIVPVTLRAPGQAIRLRGQVMWTETFHPAMSRIPQKAVGILFQGLSEDDRAFLASSVEKWREAEEREGAAAQQRSFFAKWLAGGPGSSGSPGEAGGGFRLEGAFHRLHQKVEGVVGQTLSLFHPHGALAAPVGSKGNKARNRRSR
ncbi:MAG: PilZ domain-containing protein [Nitrospirota bacterium]